MIASLRGTVLALSEGRAVVEVGGIGYEVAMTAHALSHLVVGRETLVLVEESVAMYGGGVSLYGFLSPAEKSLFAAFRVSVPSTGAKKALEYLDKASKSLPDFRRAILEKDAKLLTGVFGFSKKTAERLIDALKDKLEGVVVPGGERLRPAEAPAVTGELSQAAAALTSLGYKPLEVRTALAAVTEEIQGRQLGAEALVRLALKRL